MAEERHEAMGQADLHGIERVERAAWLDLFSMAPEDCVARLGLRSTRHPVAAVLAAREAPLVEFNRTLALGIDRPAGRSDLDRLAEWMRTHCNPVRALAVPPGASRGTILAWLRDGGGTPHGSGVAKLHRDASPAPDPACRTSLAVRLAEAAEAARYGAVVQGGFEAPPPFARWFSGLVGRPGWTTCLAYDGDVPVASGALFLNGGGCAWVGVTATLPSHRRRGAQAAIVARLLREGAAKGVAGFAAETTQPPTEEDGAHGSYRNLLRAGFSVAYLRPEYRFS
jgi:GNAT superfamily N-acetyltransferase